MSAANLGKMLACVPASQASAESVFSAADFLADGHPRIAFEKLTAEVYIHPGLFGETVKTSTSHQTRIFWDDHAS